MKGEERVHEEGFEFCEVDLAIFVHVKLFYQPIKFDREAVLVADYPAEFPVVNRACFISVASECHKRVH